MQDRRGLDVNVLLFAAWAGAACGVRLTASGLARADAAVASWRAEVVHPLRVVRRRVKREDAALYGRLKEAELAAERIQQDRLFAIAGLIPAASRPDAGAALAEENLRLLVPGDDPADVVAMRAILGALA